MFKKKDKFIELLLKMSENNCEGAKCFAKCEDTNETSLSAKRKMISELESKGDGYFRDMMKLLNEAFITPIEREDLMALAKALDDVIDEIEHCTALREMVALNEVNDHETLFLENIVIANELILESIKILATKGVSGVTERTTKINACEAKCDSIYRNAVKELFATEKDPIAVFKRKEMYDLLEKIANNCQTVAHIIDSIIMKNA